MKDTGPDSSDEVQSGFELGSLLVANLFTYSAHAWNTYVGQTSSYGEKKHAEPEETLVITASPWTERLGQ